MEKFLEIEKPKGRAFTIGDVHGCADELRLLLAHLEEVEKFGEEDITIFIGDYVDRGRFSREVIEEIIAFSARHEGRVHALRGNHEDMLLGFLGRGGAMEHAYLLNGGKPTLESYGFDSPFDMKKIRKHFPEEHIEFMEGLHRYIIMDKFVFVHAGLNPLRDLRFQLDEDIYWIRDEFIGNLHHFQKTVVFGHTPFEDVMFHLPFKIGIDTGAVFGGQLSCVEVIEERVIQVEFQGDEVFKATYEEKGGLWPQI